MSRSELPLCRSLSWSAIDHLRRNQTSPSPRRQAKMAITSNATVLGHAFPHETGHIHKPGIGVASEFAFFFGVDNRKHNPQLSQPEPNDESDFFTDEDLFDEITDDEARGLGILVRTDSSNNEAWRSFLAKLKEGEGEFSSSPNEKEDTDMHQSEPSDSAPTPASDGDSESSSGRDSGPIISILDPSPEILPYFSEISNLTALRLLSDVDLRRLTISPNVKRFDPPNPIVDFDGWQEIYHGKTLWIYDAMSNQDQCARLVSKRSDFYGTAT